MKGNIEFLPCNVLVFDGYYNRLSQLIDNNGLKQQTFHKHRYFFCLLLCHRYELKKNGARIWLISLGF